MKASTLHCRNAGWSGRAYLARPPAEVGSTWGGGAPWEIKSSWLAATVAGKHDEREQFHDGDNLGLIPLVRRSAKGLLVYRPTVEAWKIFAAQSTSPIRSRVASPPVIRVRAVAPGSASLSRIGKSFSKTAEKLVWGASSCNPTKSSASQKSSQRLSFSCGSSDSTSSMTQALLLACGLTGPAGCP